MCSTCVVVCVVVWCGLLVVWWWCGGGGRSGVEGSRVGSGFVGVWYVRAVMERSEL